MTWENRIIVILIGVFAITLAWTVPAVKRLFKSFTSAESTTSSKTKKGEGDT